MVNCLKKKSYISGIPPLPLVPPLAFWIGHLTSLDLWTSVFPLVKYIIPIVPISHLWIYVVLGCCHIAVKFFKASICEWHRMDTKNQKRLFSLSGLTLSFCSWGTRSPKHFMTFSRLLSLGARPGICISGSQSVLTLSTTYTNSVPCCIFSNLILIKSF